MLWHSLDAPFCVPSLLALRAASLSLHMPVLMCVYTPLPSRSNFYMHSVRYIDQNYTYPNSLSLTDQGQLSRVKGEPESPSLFMFYKPETEVVILLCYPYCILVSDIWSTFTTAVNFSISSFHICVKNYSSLPALNCVAEYSHDFKLMYQKLIPPHLLLVAPGGGVLVHLIVFYTFGQPSCPFLCLSHFWLEQKDQKCTKHWRFKHITDLYTGIITLPICSLFISLYFLRFDLLFDFYWILSWCFYRTSYDIPNISLLNDNSQPRAHNFVTKALLLLPV